MGWTSPQSIRALGVPQAAQRGGQPPRGSGSAAAQLDLRLLLLEPPLLRLELVRLVLFRVDVAPVRRLAVPLLRLDVLRLEVLRLDVPDVLRFDVPRVGVLVVRLAAV